MHVVILPGHMLPPFLLCPTPTPYLALSTDIFIFIDVILVSPNCLTLEEDDELKIVNIQFNSPM